MKTPKHLATAMAVAMVSTSVAPVMAATTTSNEEIIGKNRTETAVKISQDGWKKAETVILVNDSAIPDALTATPLAYAKNAPILLTGKDGLSKETADEIKRLGAKDVIMIGGDAVLTSKVEEGLKALKLKVDRIKGSTREETALAIAKRLDGIKDVSEIAVVNGVTGLADAVSVAAASAEKGMPILLANPKSGLTLVEKFIKDESIKSSFIIGGDKAVSNEIVKNLPGKQRIEGANRNETNAKVIEKFYADRELDNLYVAKDGMENSGHLIDALAVGSLAAKNGAPVLIASKKLNEKQINVINTKKISTITQVGGNGNEKAFGELKEIEKSEVIKVKNEAELQEALKKANANDVIEIESSASISKDVTLSTNNAVEINVKGDLKGEVTVKAPNADIKNSGTIGTLVVENGKNTTVTNTSGGKIDKVEVSSSSENVKVENKGTITQVENNATGTTIENNGTISKPVTGTEKPSVEGNKPGGSTSGGGGSSSGTVTPAPQPELDASKKDINNVAKAGMKYEYLKNRKFEYLYTGDLEYKVKSTDSIDVTFAGNYTKVDTFEDELKDEMDHYLGGIYKGSYLQKNNVGENETIKNETIIKKIKYNEKEYTWNDSNSTNNVSKWENTTETTTNLLDDISNDMNSSLKKTTITLVDKNGNELNLTMNYRIKEAIAKVNNKEYVSLGKAITAAINESSGEAAGITVTLMKDATAGGMGIFNGKKPDNLKVNLTIDLDNHTYTLTDPAVGSPGTESQGFHFEKDNTVTVKNGTVNVASNSKRTIMMFQNYCKLTLENLNLNGGAATQYIISSNYGDMVLNNVSMDGTFKSTNGEKLIAIDVMHWENVAAYNDKAPTVTITNDLSHEINGVLDVYCYGQTGTNSEGKPVYGRKDNPCENPSTLTINGGIYKNTGKTLEEFKKYTKEKKVEDLSNGSYKVTEK